jgi:hypothetical protein
MDGPGSYVSAKSNLSITTGSILSDTPPGAGAWPNSNLALNARLQYEHPSLNSQLQYEDPALATHRIPEWGQSEGEVYLPPSQECLENQLESELKNRCVCKECAAKGIPLIFCLTNGKGDHCMGPSWVEIVSACSLGQPEDTKKDVLPPKNRVADLIQPPTAPQCIIPQSQRVLSNLLKSTKKKKKLRYSASLPVMLTMAKNWQESRTRTRAMGSETLGIFFYEPIAALQPSNECFSSSAISKLETYPSSALCP